MVDVVGALSDGSVPCKFDTDVNAPALAEFKVGVVFSRHDCYAARNGQHSALHNAISTRPLTGLYACLCLHSHV